MEYQSGNMPLPVSAVSDVERADFIKKTYLHLALAVLAFIGFEALFLSIPAIRNIGLQMTQGWYWLIALGGFMFVTTMADRWAMTSTSRPAQYAALALYAAAQAFIFIPLIYMAIAMSGSTNLIGQAGIITLSLFTGLTAVAFFTGKNFSFLRTGLMMGGFLAMGLIVASIAFGFELGLWFSFGMVGLASISILYQTSQMLHVYRTDQYVAASLGLFASLMLLFWYVLRIVMAFSSE